MTPEQKQILVNEAGRLTRADVQEVLEHYGDRSLALANMQSFLAGVTCLNEEQKSMIINDLESYVY